MSERVETLLKAEFGKRHYNQKNISSLLEQSFSSRRVWIEGLDPVIRVPSVMERYQCFSQYLHVSFIKSWNNWRLGNRLSINFRKLLCKSAPSIFNSRRQTVKNLSYVRVHTLSVQILVTLNFLSSLFGSYFFCKNLFMSLYQFFYLFKKFEYVFFLCKVSIHARLFKNPCKICGKRQFAKIPSQRFILFKVVCCICSFSYFFTVQIVDELELILKDDSFEENLSLEIDHLVYFAMQKCGLPPPKVGKGKWNCNFVMNIFLKNQR